MPETVRVRFRTERETGVERVLREYVLDATERLRELDACSHVSFAPAAHPETDDRRAVDLVVTGDTDAVAEQERDHWEALGDEDYVEGWEREVLMDAEEMDEAADSPKRDVGATLTGLSTRVAGLAYDAFDDLDTRPGAVETFPDDDSPGSVGWWSFLHVLTVQMNYTLDEELDAYAHGIEHTLRNIGEYEGEDAVDERVDDLVDSLESQREAFKDGRLDT